MILKYVRVVNYVCIEQLQQNKHFYIVKAPQVYTQINIISRPYVLVAYADYPACERYSQFNYWTEIALARDSLIIGYQKYKGYCNSGRCSLLRFRDGHLCFVTDDQDCIQSGDVLKDSVLCRGFKNSKHIIDIKLSVCDCKCKIEMLI